MNRADLLEGYRLMVESRAIDDECARLLDEGVPVPNYHGARGQEALYAGVGLAMEQADRLLYNYRAFATLRAKGVSLDELLNDLLMTRAGTTRGHGGIMHVTAPELGVIGRNGVFGSKFGIALGLAQELVVHEIQACVVCMFGEAEGNRGGLYEALNIAALRNLPIVFVAENNGYAVAADTAALYASGDMSSMLRGFPLPVSKIDGNDFVAVWSELTALCARARSGNGPAYVECVTYRLDPHHAFDDDSKYRSTQELKTAWEHEPIGRLESRLRASGHNGPELERIREEIGGTVRRAVEDARRSPRPSLNHVYSQVYLASHEGV